MRPEPPPAAAWFGALLGPVRGPVAAAWRRLPGAPECVPRAGLGGAVVAQVARGWGTRRWQEAGRVAITAIEALNQLVHRGLPLEAERGAWLTADLRLAIGVARRVGRSDEALLRRVACRFVDAPGFGSVPSPEAVLFLRGAVAAGVIAGAVPDAIHAALDAWACALGSAIEATEQGEEKERSSFLALAVSALEGVPDADAMIGLAEGQRAELARAGDLDLTLADWYAIAAAKTARLFRCAASCGGRLGCERPPLVSGRPSVGSHLRSKRLVIGDSRDSTEIGSPAPC